MKILNKTLAATVLYLAMPSEAEAKKYPECYFVEACGKEQIAKLQEALDEIKYDVSLTSTGEKIHFSQLDFDKFDCVYVDLPAKPAQQVKAEIGGEFVELPDFKFNHIAYPFGGGCQRKEYPHERIGELRQYIHDYRMQLSYWGLQAWTGICFSGTNCWGGTNPAIWAPLRSSELHSVSADTEHLSLENAEQTTTASSSLHKKSELTVNYCNYGILFDAVTSSLLGEQLRKEGLLKKPLVADLVNGDLIEADPERLITVKWDLYCDPDGTVGFDYETLRKDAENPKKIYLWGYQISRPESVRVYLIDGSEGKSLTCIGSEQLYLDELVQDCNSFQSNEQALRCEEAYNNWKKTRYNWFICGPEE